MNYLIPFAFDRAIDDAFFTSPTTMFVGTPSPFGVRLHHEPPSRMPNVHETQTSITYSFDLPGVKPTDLTVQILQGNVLKVSGERKTISVDGKEHASASFSRAFTLDPKHKVITNKATSILKDGVLTVSVPKKERPALKKIALSQNEHVEKKEDENILSLAFDVPGVKAEDLTVEVDDDILKINGERKVRGSERSFHKKYQLDPSVVDTEGDVTANLADGVLVVDLPKSKKNHDGVKEIISDAQDVPLITE